MASMKKGQLAPVGHWRKHMDKFLKRTLWSRERRAEKQYFLEDVGDFGSDEEMETVTLPKPQRGICYVIANLGSKPLTIQADGNWEIAVDRKKGKIRCHPKRFAIEWRTQKHTGGWGEWQRYRTYTTTRDRTQALKALTRTSRWSGWAEFRIKEDECSGG